ncbi:glycosyltransferase [Desulfovibrio sp. TomC]|uniref:glycosyltransferase n=1 Tax=Desulfovibrio sp. TomC TaxID=1562888 RepID=UPI000573D5D1|nr:glycosyltransferase [Desulfovibrio sp. TomC]KHK02923.1 Glycosyl transferase, group 1/2 family protein [Desulfovibrio sp. TomC]
MLMPFPGAVRGKKSSLPAPTPVVGPGSFGPLAWPTWRDFSQLAQAYAEELYGYPIDVRRSAMPCLQELLCYAFIRQNVPGGARLLAVGGGRSRVLAALAPDYECWCIDAFDGVGGSAAAMPLGYGYKMLADAMGHGNPLLPAASFDFVFSIAGPGHRRPESESALRSVFEDMRRVAKPGSYALYCLDYVRREGTSSAGEGARLYRAASEFFEPVTAFTAVEDIYSTRLYALPEKPYNEFVLPVTRQKMSDFGDIFSCNALFQTPQAAPRPHHIPSGPHPLSVSVPEKRLPRLHLVTPCHNDRAFIEHTISSVVSQKGHFYLHYHVEDGGSTDGTPDLLRQWEQDIASGASPIRCAGIAFSWDSAPDVGRYDALNHVLARQAADEDFVGWLAADAFLIPGALAAVAEVAALCPNVEWVLGQGLFIRENGEVEQYDPETRYPREVAAAGLCDGQLWQSIPQAGTFWRAALWRRAGGFDPRLADAAAWDLWRRFADAAVPFQILAPLGACLQREGRTADAATASREAIDRLLPAGERRARLEALQHSGRMTVRCIEPSPAGELRNLTAPEGRQPQSGKDFFADMYGNREALRTFCRQRSRELAGRGDCGTPLFSVVTPSYNQAQYIEETIMAALLQGEDRFEHIIMDGGSTDGTVELLAHYPHLQWTSEKDRGQTHALNKALALARGDIVAWINSDDYYTPNAFAAVANAFSAPGVTMALGGCLWIYEGTDNVRLVPGRTIGFQEMIRYWNDLTPPPQPALFFRRSLLDAVGYFDENLHLTMDYDFWLRTTGQGERIIGLEALLAIYRFHGGSKSGNQDDWRPFYAEWHHCYQRYRSFAAALPPSPLLTVALPWGVPSFDQERRVRDFLERATGDKFRDMEVLIVADAQHPVPDSLLRDLPVPGRIVCAATVTPEIFLRQAYGSARGAIIWFPSLHETLENKWFMRPLNLLLDDKDRPYADVPAAIGPASHSFLPEKSAITCQRFYRLA